MGVERAVTRWYVQRQALVGEITALEAKLVEPEMQGSTREAERTEIEQQLVGLQRKLRLLGPCPRPMMG